MIVDENVKKGGGLSIDSVKSHPQSWISTPISYPVPACDLVPFPSVRCLARRVRTEFMK